jgi:hypothetical protein
MHYNKSINKKEKVNSMKTVQIEYERISPAILEMMIKKAFPQAMCKWKDVDEDFFEFTVFGVADLAELEDILAEWV